MPTQHHHFCEIDGLGLSVSGRGAAAPLPNPRKLSRYPGHQRSRLTYPAPGAARHRQGKQHHCFALDRRSGSFNQLARRCCAMPKHWVSPRCASCGYPVASSAVMCHCKSLRLIAGPQHRFRGFDGLGCQSVHAALLRPVQGAAEVHGQCFARAWSERCGAGCGHASLRIVAGCWIDGGDGIHSCGHTLRFYIRPHCVKCLASQSQAPLWPCTASRPAGLRSRHYAKWPALVRACQSSALPRSVPALRAANCRPGAVLALWV